jgi:pre-mRNA-processing factor 19
LKGHNDAVTQISFSENGYYVLSSSLDSTVRLWDLRKLTNIETINTDSAVHSVKFDQTGTYFAIGSIEISIYETKTMNKLISFQDHKKNVTQVTFGKDSQILVSTSLDRNLKVFGGTNKKK